MANSPTAAFPRRTTSRANFRQTPPFPFGRGNPFLNDGVGGAIFGDWQISAIINKSSGFPRDPAVGQDVPNTGSQTYRPNLVAGQDPNDGPQTVQQWFNTAAFARPDTFTYGDAGRNIVVGPGIFTTDASLIRNVFFGGTKSLQSGWRRSTCSTSPYGATRRWQCRARSTGRSTPPASRCASCRSA
jgi:hypothetical protein